MTLFTLEIQQLTKSLVCIWTLIIAAFRKQLVGVYFSFFNSPKVQHVTSLTYKCIVLGLSEVLKTLASEVRPALFSVFPVNTTTVTTGSWMSV